MLILSRKKGQQVMIGRDISVTVLDIRGNSVRLGFAGPKELPIHRHEVYEKIVADQPPRKRAACA